MAKQLPEAAHKEAAAPDILNTPILTLIRAGWQTVFVVISRYIVLIVAVCIGAFLFYLYDYRPEHIRIECEKASSVTAMEMMNQRAEMGPSSGQTFLSRLSIETM